MSAAASTSRKRHASSSVSSTVGDVSTEYPICLDQMTEPKILFCGHNLCNKCVESIAQSAQATSGQLYKKYPCPICKQGTAVKEGQQVPTNYALKELMDKAKKMRRDEQEKDKLIQQLTGGKSPIECEVCREKTPWNKGYACLRDECLVRYEWEEAGRPNCNTALLAKKLCSNCVCLYHHCHEITGVEKMATVEEIADAVKTVKTLMDSMRQYILNTAKNSKFSVQLMKPIVKDGLGEQFHKALTAIRAPPRPLHKAHLTSKCDSIKSVCDDTERFLESTEWMEKMQKAVGECYKKALEDYEEERYEARQE